MKHFLTTLLFSTCLTIFSSAHAQTPPRVLASVHPLALVVASLLPMDQIDVLVPKGMTPHDFSLRPSDIESIQLADVIIWAGADAEPYLKGFVQRWPDKIWLDVSQFKTDQDPNDPHWWLSPHMMVAAQQQLAQRLQLDAGDFAKEVELTVAQSQAQLSELRGRGFLVFHRAYDHFVQLLQLNQLGAFTLSPEHKPGAKTLQKIRDQLSQGDVVCVFSEPEYSPALVESVLKGTTAKRGELDPMATEIPLQADGYVVFLQDLTRRFAACLQP